jgi:hypothetical protein
MQSFLFLFRHIAGKANIVADWQTRFDILTFIANYTESLLAIDTVPSEGPTPLEMMKECHEGRAGHCGAKRTWQLLRDRYPGNNIPIAAIYAFIDTCPVCQKVRYTGDIGHGPVVRTLRVEDPTHRVVGIDWLSLQKDSLGNTGLYTIKHQFTKHIHLYAFPTNSMINAAEALFRHYVSFGTFDAVSSDPGSDFMSQVISSLNSWFGIHHRVSLVDRHTSNGNEESNKEILRFVRALVAEERIADRWSSPSVLGWCNLLLNTFVNSETGHSPLELTFGSQVLRRFDFPLSPLSVETAPSYLKMLNEDLALVTKHADECQLRQVNRRLAPNLAKPQGLYQPGDFVTFKRPSSQPMPSKLSFRYAGPYEVITHTKNDVSCRHMATGLVKTFAVEHLNIYAASREEAYQMAVVDVDHHEIDCIRTYRGDALKRTTMEFLVRFADTSELWLPLNDDLFALPLFEDYIRRNPALSPLLYLAKDVPQYLRDLQQLPITEVSPGDWIYLDLRTFGSAWYFSLGLPDADFTAYVVHCQYSRWIRAGRIIELHCPLFQEMYQVRRDYILHYGLHRDLAETMTVVDSEFVRQFPSLAPRRNPRRH